MPVRSLLENEEMIEDLIRKTMDQLKKAHTQ
jgi:hypothetical protein